jgi:hypothetical protein
MPIRALAPLADVMRLADFMLLNPLVMNKCEST